MRSGRRGQRDVDVAQLLIRRQRGPGGHVAYIFRRTFAPGVVTGFSLTRQNVERPELLASPYVITADILRFCFGIVAAIAVPTAGLAASIAANDNDIVHDERTRPSEVPRLIESMPIQRES